MEFTTDILSVFDKKWALITAGDSMSFNEADVTLVCKKLFKQQLDVANMPEDVAKAMYEGQAPHDMYIGEIVDIIRKG